MEFWESERERLASEGILHVRQFPEKEMAGLRQRSSAVPDEKCCEGIFHAENAYGNISLGMASDGTLTFAVSKKKYYDGPIAEMNARELNQQRCNAWNHPAGQLQLNNGGHENSAFAFQADKESMNGRELIGESCQFGAWKKQRTIGETLSLSPDRRKALERQMDLAMRGVREKQETGEGKSVQQEEYSPPAKSKKKKKGKNSPDCL